MQHFLKKCGNTEKKNIQTNRVPGQGLLTATLLRKTANSQELPVCRAHMHKPAHVEVTTRGHGCGKSATPTTACPSEHSL